MGELAFKLAIHYKRGKIDGESIAMFMSGCESSELFIVTPAPARSLAYADSGQDI
jgi:hypothetical protein